MFNLAQVNFIFSDNLAPGPFRPPAELQWKPRGCRWGAAFVIPARRNRLEEHSPKQFQHSSICLEAITPGTAA